MQRYFLSSKTAVAGLALAGTSLAHADFIFSGDFTRGEGQIELTGDLNFNVVDGGFLTYFIFDDIVTFDGNFTQQSGAANLSLLLNTNPQPTGAVDLIDNLNNIVGSLDSSDGGFRLQFADEFFVVPGDVVTLEAGTWSNLGDTDFNPQYNSVGTFAGTVQLATGAGDILAEHQCTPIPEPSALALLALGLLATNRRRRS